MQLLWEGEEESRHSAPAAWLRAGAKYPGAIHEEAATLLCFSGHLTLFYQKFVFANQRTIFCVASDRAS